MPPPILDDSEDDDGDVLYDDAKESTSMRSSGDSAPDVWSLDGTRDTIDQSTGSTDRLRTQIADAQRRLCGDSSENAQSNDKNTAHAASDSVTLDRNKRRHSVIAKPGLLSDPPRTVQRSKTVKSYSTRKPIPSSVERDQFIARFGENAVAPESSRSVRYLDHSGMRSSNGLPTGSMQNEFMNHEPAMFKESGSTIPDNESSHERMVEQALRSKPLKGESSPDLKLFDSTEMPKSSSFPWSVSEQTESARSTRFGDMNRQKTSVEGEAEGRSQNAVDQIEPGHEHHDAASAAVTEQAQAFEKSHPPNDADDTHGCSPIVEVNVIEAKASALAEPYVVPISMTQKSGRERKRKVQDESSEPLNSDDVAVGLPKERYKPRPSKRRATHNVEESIDNSVVVETAAKKKRSRTMGGSFTSVEDPLQGPTTQRSSKPEKDQEIITVEGTAGHHEPAAEESVEIAQAHEQPTDPPQPSPIVEVPATKSEQTQDQIKATDDQAGRNTSHCQADETVFVKPAGKLKKPASKSKRSATTIFEDHVDFTGKQRSPSLSQQQAMRQTALRDVKNEASPAQARRGRKSIVADEDDEDELALDSDHNSEQPEAPPKKRGRGRPRKETSKTETQTEDSNLPNADTEIKDDEPSTKKRRGRPPKLAPPPLAPTSNDTAEPSPTNPEPEEAKPSPEPPAENVRSKPPTPSPEKHLPAAVPEKTPAPPSPTKPPKPSPPTHSPIKRASPAPYRVGLSRKRQIPSLLKVVNPRPPRNG